MSGDLRQPQGGLPVLQGAQAGVHPAVAMHVTSGKTADEYLQRVNAESTLELALAAVEAGVTTFVLASSIKVQGESSVDGPLRAPDPPRLPNACGKSELRAEQALQALASVTPTLEAAARVGRILPLGAIGAARCM